MRLMRGFLAGAVLGGALMTAQACASSGNTVSSEAAGILANNPNAAVLKVTDNNFQDMDVFAVLDGVATRLGTVTGAGGSRMFVLDPSYLSSSHLAVVATPVGGGGRASTGQIVVNRGDEVDFIVQPQLSTSSVFIR